MIIGIDPGMKGGLALLHKGNLVEVIDMPCAQGVSAAGVAEWMGNWIDPLRMVQNITVVIEDVHAMPKQGVTSSFNFGLGKGILLGVVAALGLEVQLVSPSTWKRQMGLTSDKDLCRQRAIELWPTHYDKFSRKKDDGRAEAALLARWYYDKFERTNNP